jgi:hypothetical protein
VGETRFELICKRTGEAKAAGTKPFVEAALRLMVMYG